MIKHLGYATHARKGKPIRAIKSHIKYIELEKEKHRDPVHLFSKDVDQIKRKDFFVKLNEQKRQGVVAHKLIFSMSEDEKNRLGVSYKELLRETFEKYEEKYKTKLDWIASVHNDEGHPHAHVIIRGRDESGKQVYLRDYHLNYLKKIAELAKERIAERNLERGLEEPRKFNFFQELEVERELSPSPHKTRDQDLELELSR